MNGPVLYLAWPHRDEARLARVIVWPDQPHRLNAYCLPTVALAVDGQPGVWDRPHTISREVLAASYVSEDPEAALSAVARQQISAWVESEDDPHPEPDEDDALTWTDLDTEEEAS